MPSKHRRYNKRRRCYARRFIHKTRKAAVLSGDMCLECPLDVIDNPMLARRSCSQSTGALANSQPSSNIDPDRDLGKENTFQSSNKRSIESLTNESQDIPSKRAKQQSLDQSSLVSDMPTIDETDNEVLPMVREYSTQKYYLRKLSINDLQSPIKSSKKRYLLVS